MWSVILLILKLISISVSNEERNNCYFTVFYSNGKRSYCIDEQCYHHLDIISLKDRQCRTNYLSLQFSSYLTYKKFLQSTLLKNSLSYYFSKARPNVERLLRIEFLSPFLNDDPFQLDQLRLLANSISNIDTYEFIFNENITINNLTLFIDQDMFSSSDQQIIDRLTLRFSCTHIQRVEWQLIKSIQSFPNSPCPQQIQLKKKDFRQKEFSSNLIILASITTLVSITIIILVLIGSFLYNYDFNDQLKQNTKSNSRTDLITIIEKF
ncbi:unnamed protein product [Rotaria socialis]|uniref:Transmembrane protein n=1 Tax=Rotaria socialis TaxID=392032 RepID=A0A817TLR6_9BILA|nr:unnamed protein product [Rotaria socialis]CAF4535994.1 unnamed protein product [Rotaria socialis]